MTSSVTMCSCAYRKSSDITETRLTKQSIRTLLRHCYGSCLMGWTTSTGKVYFCLREMNYSCIMTNNLHYYLLERWCSNWIIHRDLKPSNILVGVSSYFKGKLGSCPLWHWNILALSSIFLNLNGQVMGEGEEQGVVKIADFGLARIYQAPLKPLSENGVGCIVSYISPSFPFPSHSLTVQR